MKLSAAYNAFDGLELLPHSLKSIRKSVDCIIVVWQNISNHGNESEVNTAKVLEALQVQGLIDVIIHYDTDFKKTPHQNELAKRNVGLNYARNNGYTHHLNIDCDELYLKAEFDLAKRIISSNDIEATACKMKTYYKYPNCIITPAEEYYVPFIHKITHANYTLSTKWNLLADPTRKVPCKLVHEFSRLELTMHHLSYIRNNIRVKLDNSSANVNFKKRIDKLEEHYNNFKINGKAMLAGSEERIYSTTQTANIIDLIG